MKVSKRELQRIIREEKVRLRREEKRSASRKTSSISGDAGKKTRANRLRRLKEQSTRRPLQEGLTQEENLANAITEYVNALADQLGEDPLDLKPDVMGQVDAWFEGEAAMEYNQ